MLAALAELIGRNMSVDGSLKTALPRVTLIRSSEVTEPTHTIYPPSCCIVAQGRKRVRLGGVDHVYDASHYLVVGMDLPAIGAVIEASSDEPYLCLCLELNREVLAELVTQRPETGRRAASGLSAATAEIIDASCRMLRLLDAPDDAVALAPLIERELLYRLLTGPQGHVLRDIASGDGQLNRIARAVSFITENYREPFVIDSLAEAVGMSRSSFHAHFRSVTSMSPIRFRTMLRLQEARRLMLSEGLSAAEAGFRVGYQSPSQFSRDYTRIFRSPPHSDIQRMRGKATEDHGHAAASAPVYAI
jgi:AraC-like DNA-binding protein